MGFGENLLVFLQIVLINVLLSGDNAVVIAMAGQRLPPGQRRAAIWWGSAAAVVLRCVLTVGAVTLLKIPLLQTAGALLLFAIALKLLAENHGHSQRTEAAGTLSGAVWTIVTADFVMSLDNVLAIAAVARGDVVLLVIGIAMSIPLIIWGSSFMMNALDRLPFLVYIGGALLGYAAGDMVLKDPAWNRWLPQLSPQAAEALPFVAVAILLAAALWLRRRRV